MIKCDFFQFFRLLLSFFSVWIILFYQTHIISIISTTFFAANDVKRNIHVCRVFQTRLDVIPFKDLLLLPHKDTRTLKKSVGFCHYKAIMWEIHTYLPDEYICIIEKHLIQVFSIKHFPRQHAPKYFLRDRLLFQSLQSRLLELTFSEHCLFYHSF